MRASRRIPRWLAILALCCLPLLASCAMIQITAAAPGPGTATAGPGATGEPSGTPTADQAATQDAGRFRETVQAFQTESAAENATERAATARPSTTPASAAGETATPIPETDLQTLDISNVARLEQLDIFQLDPLEQALVLRDSGLLEVQTAAHILLYDLERLQEVIRVPRAEVNALAVSADRGLLVSGSEDGSVAVETLPAGERQVYTDEFLGISAVALSPDNQLLAALTKEGDLKIWDRRNGEQLVSFFARFYFDYASFGTWLGFSPAGERIAAYAGQSASLLVWQTGGLLGSEAEPAFIAWREPLFEAERYLLSPTWDTSLWWRDQSARLVDLDGRAHGQELAFDGPVLEAAFSPDGAAFFVAFETVRDGVLYGTLRSFNSDSVEPGFSFEHPAALTAWRLSPNGRQAAIGYQDGTLVLWDASTGQPVYDLAGHSGALVNLAFSPDGRLLASTARDGTLRFWGVSSGGSLATLPASSGERSWMDFSSTGRVLVMAADFGQVRLLGVRP